MRFSKGLKIVYELKRSEERTKLVEWKSIQQKVNVEKIKDQLANKPYGFILKHGPEIIGDLEKAAENVLKLPQ